MEYTKEEMLVLQGAIWQFSISSLTLLFYPPHLPMSLLSLLQSPVSYCAGTVSILGHSCGIYGGQSDSITDLIILNRYALYYGKRVLHDQMCTNVSFPSTYILPEGTYRYITFLLVYVQTGLLTKSERKRALCQEKIMSLLRHTENLKNILHKISSHNSA